MAGRPRRSLHFVPGGQERMIAKALTLPADGLILDLEEMLGRRVDVIEIRRPSPNTEPVLRDAVDL